MLQRRAAMLRAVRDYFNARDFIEVTTPVLFRASTFNPHIQEFQTRFVSHGSQTDLLLQTSPEHYMKRLLAGGEQKIFQICPFFRNGEMGAVHNPEFTGLEFYEVGTDYHGIMAHTEAVIAQVAADRSAIRYQGPIDFTPPWPRMSVAEAFERFASVRLEPATDLAGLLGQAEKIGIRTSSDDLFDDVFFRIFLEKIEPNFPTDRPIFLHDYPASMAVMARMRGGWAERVELFVGGVELANGFSEETDAVLQRARFESDRAQMRRDDWPLDEEFLAALEHLPECAGIAIGLDRLLMVLTQSRSIGEVMSFPF